MTRTWHPWTSWECYRAGFFATELPRGMTPDQARQAYAEFLCDLPRFERAMERVLAEWPCSCEHWLSNEQMNRIAWLGQAAMCIDTGIPARFRAGFKLMRDADQAAANAAALRALNRWLAQRARFATTGVDPLGELVLS